jgi:hypothetical protein
VVIVGGLLAVAPPAIAMADPAIGAPETIARRAVADALGLDPAEFRVISSVPRDFPDASLGCPQPDAAYAQVITPGYQVLIEADGRRFDVRVAGPTGRICQRHKMLPAAKEPARPSPRRLAEAARQDLAVRLGLSPDAVTVTRIRRLTPGAELPGCGEVCSADTAPENCGLVIALAADDRTFSYLAGYAGVRPCPEIADR